MDILSLENSNQEAQYGDDKNPNVADASNETQHLNSHEQAYETCDESNAMYHKPQKEEHEHSKPDPAVMRVNAGKCKYECRKNSRASQHYGNDCHTPRPL